MAYIRRSLEDVFLRLNEQYPVILVTGIRQVGKTTMLLKLMEREKVQRTYISLDDINERTLAQRSPETFFQLHQPPVVIEKVQYAPEIIPYIKKMVDQNHRPGDFWLTSSPLVTVTNRVKKILAEEAAHLSLLPLSQQEIYSEISGPFVPDRQILSAKQIKLKPIKEENLFSRILQGGMPALVSGCCMNRDAFYSNFITTFEQELQEWYGVIDVEKFLGFITITAMHTGQLIDYKDIADACGISQITVKNWIRILAMMKISFFLEPYPFLSDRRMTKTSKLYFYDTGLVCYLAKYNSVKEVMAGTLNETLLETYSVSEIVKSHINTVKDLPIYHYKDRTGRKIDVVMKVNEQFSPIEIMRTNIPTTKSLHEFQMVDKLITRRGTRAVLCTAEQLDTFGEGDLIIPIFLI